MSAPVAVVGAGGWGTALAVVMARSGRPVTLWARRREHAEALVGDGENKIYLPGVKLPHGLRVTADLGEVTKCRCIVLAVPAQSVRKTWERLVTHLGRDHTIANAAKGLEIPTGLRMSQVLEAGAGPVRPERLATLSGPNHAEEVGLGLPTTSVIASRDAATAEEWQEILMTPSLRVYTNDDVIGVELGGALKNIIALAAGISDGLGYGDNTKAALLTRGLAEMSRLGVAQGARLLTFSGLSGIGDLIATCTSAHSRNTRAGRAIGEGQSPEDVIKSTSMVIEGITTCRAALALSLELRVDMPITRAVGQVLFEGKLPQEAVGDLMGRGPKDELGALGGSAFI